MLHRRVLTVVFMVSLLAASAALAGTITGTITYDDKVPKLPRVSMDADPSCAAKHSGPVLSNVLVLGDGNTLANVFVQVKNAPAVEHKPPGEPLVIDQKGCRYEPKVAGAMVGQEVLFKNSDGILHNVHGLPKENRGFNIGMPPMIKESAKTFNKPEPLFPVKCDVHPWMRAYIAVMTHPFFSVTGTDGAFEISDLPDGTYEIEAWHEKLGSQTAKVTISGGKGSTDFSFKKPTKK